jgi:periplasmic protein TonB
MLVARCLVPVELEVARVASATEGPQGGITLRSSTGAAYARQARRAPHKEFLLGSMLENSPTRPGRRTGDFIVSAAVQTIFLIGLLLLPLYFSEAIDIHQLTKTLLVAPPPPAPPPPPASLAGARSAAPKRSAPSVERHFVAPRVIPRQVARVNEEPGENDLGSGTLPGEGSPGGVTGGIPGGLAGGVIGGQLSGPAPPSPIDSAPKEPIRVGGEVKRPRLIFGPDPVYPLLARHSKISGAVVIDAVIDTQGNVVDMHPASGNPLLLIAAMAALRQWKYEPTILGGQAYPVRMLVTIAFELKDR